jgi:DNA-directed RNA polymerase subunit RPC12/RpoP
VIDLNFFEHFPNEISQEIRDYITNDVMDWSRYLFTHRKGKKQYGFCTHCKQEYLTNGLRHGQLEECPHCGSEAFVKASGRGRKTLIDTAYLLWYEKSIIDPAVIIARGFYATRDYTKDYQKTETEIRVIALYLFEWGKGGKMFRRDHWDRSTKWYESQTVYSEATRSMKYTSCYHSVENMKAAVQNTPFQYCTWEQYGFTDRVEVFDFAAKYPCMEYLTKLGMGAVINAKLYGQPTFGAINWRGTSIDKVLRLSKAEAKEWVKQPFKGGLLSLYAYQFFNKKLNMGFTFEQAHQLASLARKEYFHDLMPLVSYAPLKKILLYILRQINRKEHRGHSAFTLVRDWQDYLKECHELGMDTRQESVLFPNSLHDAHQKTIKKIKFKRDEELNTKIILRAKELDQQYRFEYNGLMIRPAASIQELFQEGKALQHCVGGYAQRYAEGHIELFVIRRIGEPDKPFYTMEVCIGKVMQCRGFKNCSMTDEVKAFVELFKAEKLEKKRARVKAVAQQEVAV